MPDPAIDVVLFDLGGVLFDFGGVGPMKSLSGIGDDDEIWRRWLGCRWVRSFERGHCSADEFAAGVVADWELPIAPAEFLESFDAWLGGPLTGADALVADVRAREMTVGCLSNTNSRHWTGRWQDSELFAAFDVRFLSFEMGCVKPDREIFDRAARQLDCAPGRILFIDDNTINVDGAQAAGWRAVRAVGVDDAREQLMTAGLL